MGQVDSFVMGLTMAALSTTGCSGRVIDDRGSTTAGGAGASASGGSGNSPHSAQAGDAAQSAGGSTVINVGSAGATMSAAGGVSATGGASSAGAPPAAVGGASASAGADNLGLWLIPNDGWIYGSSNSLGIQGAVYSFGDTTSQINMTSDFTGTHACIAGTAAKVDLNCTITPPATDCYGAYFGAEIGLNLNQAIDPATMQGGEAKPYDASALAGFAFELGGDTVPAPNALRFEVDDGTSVYCNPSTVKIKSGINTVLFSDLRTQCFRGMDAPTAETAKSALVKLTWHVITNTSSTVPFDFCVSNIRAVLK